MKVALCARQLALLVIIGICVVHLTIARGSQWHPQPQQGLDASRPGVRARMDFHSRRQVRSASANTPTCFQEIYEPQRAAGRCGKLLGGTPYCFVRGFLYMNHKDCSKTPPAPSS